MLWKRYTRKHEAGTDSRYGYRVWSAGYGVQVTGIAGAEYFQPCFWSAAVFMECTDSGKLFVDIQQDCCGMLYTPELSIFTDRHCGINNS